MFLPGMVESSWKGILLLSWSIVKGVSFTLSFKFSASLSEYKTELVSGFHGFLYHSGRQGELGVSMSSPQTPVENHIQNSHICLTDNRNLAGGAWRRPRLPPGCRWRPCACVVSSDRLACLPPVPRHSWVVTMRCSFFVRDHELTAGQSFLPGEGYDDCSTQSLLHRGTHWALCPPRESDFVQRCCSFSEHLTWTYGTVFFLKHTYSWGRPRICHGSASMLKRIGFTTRWLVNANSPFLMSL